MTFDVLSLEAQVPAALQQAIVDKPDSAWKASTKQGRDCVSLHFGLSNLRNVNQKNFFHATGNADPELERKLVDFINAAISGIGIDIQYTSIVYEMPSSGGMVSTTYPKRHSTHVCKPKCILAMGMPCE